MKKHLIRLLILLLLLFLTCTSLLTYFYLSDKAITVVVIDGQTSQPISRAVVELDIGSPNNIAYAHETESKKGVFEIRPVVNLLERTSLIQLKVSAPGYLSDTRSLALPWWQNRRKVQFSLQSISMIGQVSDAETGAPLAAAIYLYHHLTSRQVAQFQTNEAGQFSLSRIEPPIILQVEVPGYEVLETQLDSLEPYIGDSTRGLEIKLVPRATTGILRDATTNEPLIGVTLIAGPEDRRQTTTTDATASFSFKRLRPGDRIAVLPPEGYTATELTLNHEDELALSLQPRQLRVVITDSFTSQPMTGVEVQLDHTRVKTDNQGQIIFSRAPTSGQITVTRVGYGLVTVDFQDVDVLEIMLAPEALQGVVRDGQTGKALPKATLYWGDTYFQIDDGHFVIKNLSATPEPLMVKAAGYHRGYGQLAPSGIITATSPTPFSDGEGRWLVTVPCTETPSVSALPCLDFILTPSQAKAIYVPFQYLRSRDAIIGYLDFIQATDLNAIVVDVKGDFGFIGWQSGVELATTIGANEVRTDTWIPLDELVAEAKKRNIYTIARFVVFKDDPLAHGKPELAVVRADGSVWIDGEKLGWANPFREEVWDYNIALAEEVAALGFDELNFDYIRFPSDGDIGAIVYKEENTKETRTGAIREFMERLTDALRPYGIFTSADVFGLTIWVTPESDMSIGQRIIDIAPNVDYLAPMVYPSTFIPGNLGYDNPSAEPYGIVFRSQEKAKELVPTHVKVRPWLQGYWYSLDEMRLLKQAAIDAESVGWSWWNAGGKYDTELFEPAREE